MVNPLILENSQELHGVGGWTALGQEASGLGRQKRIFTSKSAGFHLREIGFYHDFANMADLTCKKWDFSSNN